MATFTKKTLQFYLNQALHRACNKKNTEGILGEMTKYFDEILNDPIEWKALMKMLIDKGIPTAAPVKEDGTVQEDRIITISYHTAYGIQNQPTPESNAGVQRYGEIQGIECRKTLGEDEISGK